MLLAILFLIGGVAQFLVGRAEEAVANQYLGGAWVALGALFLIWKLLRPGVRPGNGLATPVEQVVIAQKAGKAPLIRGLMSLIAAGASLAVGIIRIRETLTPDAAAVVPLVSGAVIGILSLMGLMAFGFTGAERSAIYQATVTVLGVREMRANNSHGRPLVRVVFDVRPTGAVNYESTALVVIPVLAVPKLVVGARFSARVAGPQKPDVVIVDWDSGQVPVGGTASVPPAVSPTPSAGQDPATRLSALDRLRSQGLVSEAEYAEQRERILDSL